ncbi:hypothetical protein MJ575_06880 [Klebsiella pneumoniae]|nr:hypothetical protein MJ575_06880 [Klebsiella pneumoniae]
MLIHNGMGTSRKLRGIEAAGCWPPRPGGAARGNVIIHVAQGTTHDESYEGDYSCSAKFCRACCRMSPGITTPRPSGASWRLLAVNLDHRAQGCKNGDARLYAGSCGHLSQVAAVMERRYSYLGGKPVFYVEQVIESTAEKYLFHAAGRSRPAYTRSNYITGFLLNRAAPTARRRTGKTPAYLN